MIDISIVKDFLTNDIINTIPFLIFGFFGAPDLPAIPAAPPAPKLTDPAVEDARKRERLAQRLRTGRGETILTSGLGTEGPEFQARNKPKTLLGE